MFENQKAKMELNSFTWTALFIFDPPREGVERGLEAHSPSAPMDEVQTGGIASEVIRALLPERSLRSQLPFGTHLRNIFAGARSRLCRCRFVRTNTTVKNPDEIYQIDILLQPSPNSKFSNGLSNSTYEFSFFFTSIVYS